MLLLIAKNLDRNLCNDTIIRCVIIHGVRAGFLKRVVLIVFCLPKIKKIVLGVHRFPSDCELRGLPGVFRVRDFLEQGDKATLYDLVFFVIAILIDL